MALLKVGGSYYSQYDLRAISALVPTEVQQKRFYLVGENDQHASSLLKLSYIEYPRESPRPKDYLAWVKKMTRAGHAVTITVFMNYKMFYSVDKDDAGEYDYDHIVSVSRIESDYDDDLYHDDDVITMEDHGLYAEDWDNPPYYFTYDFKGFIATRKQANNNNHVYSIPDVPEYGNFGIAHTGIQDNNHDCLPLLVETNVNYEKPPIKNHSEDRPAAMALTLTVTVSKLVPGVQYNLYTYNDENKVPVEAFNAAVSSSVAVKVITGPSSGTFVMTESIMSDAKRIYRCVRADAK